MKTKIKLSSVKSLQYQAHELAVLLRENYDPAGLSTSAKVSFIIEPEQHFVHVIMKVKYLYVHDADEPIELVSHTSDSVFEVFEGFDDTFELTKKGFRISQETFDGLLRFFIVTAIGINRGMLAAKTTGTLVENHPYKLLNIEEFMEFVARTNPTMQVVETTVAKKEIKSPRKKK
ncbi:MAG: hypothetical protein ACRCYO_11040 [Bacteroidia bacterium]